MLKKIAIGLMIAAPSLAYLYVVAQQNNSTAQQTLPASETPNHQQDASTLNQK